MSTSDKQTKNLTTGTNVSAGGDSGNAEDLTVFVRFLLKSLSTSLIEFQKRRSFKRVSKLKKNSQVQSLLEQMQGRFQEMSDSIIGRIDEMGSRIDDLENSISDLMQEAGVEDAKKKTPVKKKLIVVVTK